MNNTDIFKYIKQLQANGFVVTPAGKDKKPLLKNWTNRGQLTDAEIQNYFVGKKCNLGILTGEKSDLFVLDVDVKNNAGGLDSLAELETEFGKIETYTVKTPSGGYHYYFTYPKGQNIGNKVGFRKGLDIRSNGGMIVAPPSRTKDGQYTVSNKAEIAETPAWLIQELTNPKTKKAKFELPDIIEEGARNDTVFRYLCSLRAQGFSEEQIIEAARKLNLERVTPPIPDAEMEVIIKQVLGYPAGIQKYYSYTDLGNSERFADQWRNEAVYIAEAKTYFIWDGKRLEEDKSNQALQLAKKTAKKMEQEALEIEDEDARKLAISWSRKSQSKERLKAMKDLAAPDLTIDVDKLDNRNLQMNIMNGVLQFDTYKIVDHHIKFLHSKIANVEFQSGADCPRFRKFLDTTFSGDQDLISYIQRIMGYCLTGSTKEQCLFLFYGDGQNGKSVLMNVIDHILGDYSVTANANTFVKNNTSIRSDIARLNGARFVNASEVDQTQYWDEVLLKNITGGEKITARFLHKNEFEFRPRCKIIIATNNLPAVHGLDAGIWRRIRIIPFKNSLPDSQVDIDLYDKLIEEKSGVLNFALEGLRLYDKMGLATPQCVSDEVEAYRRSSDLVQQFLDDSCEIDTKSMIVSTELYHAFCRWCEDSGNDVYTQKRFGTIMGKKGFESKRNTVNGVKKYRYFGIKFKAESVEKAPWTF